MKNYSTLNEFGILELPEDEIHPHEKAYVEYIQKNPNETFVKDSVKISTKGARISWYYKKVKNGHIKSLAPYLQRVLLATVWSAKGNYKGKSYMRTLWQGLGCITPFFIVSIQLVKSNVEEKINSLDDSDDSNAPILKKQLQKLLDKVNEYISKEVEYINLDGQTRTTCAIMPYLDSKDGFTLATSGLSSSLSVFNPGSKQKYDNIAKKKFDELTELQRGFLWNTPILINFLESGNLKSITKALISLNQNEKWTEWQIIYHGNFETLFPIRIEDVLETEHKGIIYNFYDKKVDQKGKYKKEIAGFEFHIAQLLHFFEQFIPVTEKGLDPIFIGEEKSPSEKTAKLLKSYLNDYAKSFSDKDIAFKSTTILETGDYAILRLLLDNYNKADSNTKLGSFVNKFTIPSIRIINHKEFTKWYLQTIDKLEVQWIDKTKGIYNTDSYILTPNDKNPLNLTVLQDGWVSHTKGGWKIKSIEGRMMALLQKLTDRIDTLYKENVISDALDYMPSTQSLLAINDYKDSDGDLIDPTSSSDIKKIHRGHVNHKAGGGSNNPENLKPQKAKTNLQYGPTDMIQ
jgi:hypothetical protein